MQVLKKNKHEPSCINLRMLEVLNFLEFFGSFEFRQCIICTVVFIVVVYV